MNLSNIENDIDGLIVSLDAKKAFDSVEHGYIIKCLEEFGLGNFIPIFKTLYSQLHSDIIINGKVVTGFDLLARSVKQGDALSCILFILCIEPLLRNLENNARIERIRSNALGIDLPPAYAYADDVSGCIKNSAISLQEIFFEYERLTNQSGLELNADQTEIIHFKSNENHFREKEFEVRYLNKTVKLKSF